MGVDKRNNNALCSVAWFITWQTTTGMLDVYIWAIFTLQLSADYTYLMWMRVIASVTWRCSSSNRFHFHCRLPRVVFLTGGHANRTRKVVGCSEAFRRHWSRGLRWDVCLISGVVQLVGSDVLAVHLGSTCKCNRLFLWFSHSFKLRYRK